MSQAILSAIEPSHYKSRRYRRLPKQQGELLNVNNVLTALTLWMIAAITTGVGIGKVIRHCAERDKVGPNTSEHPIKKSA